MKARKYFDTSRISDDEEYFCIYCKKQIIVSQIDRENWRCNTCSNKVVISSNITGSDIIRNLAYEVERGDSIYNYYEDEWVKVLGVQECDDDTFVMLGLQNYGGHITEVDDIVDCRCSYFIKWDEIELIASD